MANSVELRHVTKIFGADTTAVNDASFVIKRGEFFSLLGPSGCGKTTLLRTIAGFETPTSGHILLDNKDISYVPPYKRNVNMVFQSYALFPHMTVYNNIAYGLKMKKTPRAQIDQAVKEMIDIVKLTGLGERKITQISGGQQQRVALARALVNHPAVLLLDEPLGALDQKLREQMQIELINLQEQVKISFIFVTHDQREALTISDRIAVMNEGRIEQIGSPKEIYEFPATRFVADFIGTSNFLQGRYQNRDRGLHRISLKEADIWVESKANFSTGEPITIVIRPEKISISKERDPAHVNALQGVIEDILYVGSNTRYFVRIPALDMILQVFAQNFLHTAKRQFTWFDNVYVSWDLGSTSILRDKRQ